MGDLLSEIKQCFSQGAMTVNESRKKRNNRERKKSEGGIVTAIRRKLSTESVTMKPPCFDDGDDITDKDVELLDLSVQQKGGEVTVTVLNDIDPRWFRKSAKIFFQWQLLQNGVI